VCGIAGIWSLGGDIRQSEKITMNDLLAHRGPDDEGSVGVMEVPSHPDELIYRLCVLSQTRDAILLAEQSQVKRTG